MMLHYFKHIEINNKLFLSNLEEKINKTEKIEDVVKYLYYIRRSLIKMPK